jgi:hypothetical protein
LKLLTEAVNQWWLSLMRSKGMCSGDRPATASVRFAKATEVRRSCINLCSESGSGHSYSIMTTSIWWIGLLRSQFSPESINTCQNAAILNEPNCCVPVTVVISACRCSVLGTLSDSTPDDGSRLFSDWFSMGKERGTCRLAINDKEEPIHKTVH